MAEYLTDCDLDETPLRHEHHPILLLCMVCGAPSDEFGSYASRTCPGPPERAG